MPTSDHPSFGPPSGTSRGPSPGGPQRPPGVRAAAAWAYLSAACPRRLAEIENIAEHVAGLEREWWSRAVSLVDQISVAMVWRDRPEVTGWPGATPSRDELIERVVDDLFSLWRPDPEAADPPAPERAGRVTTGLDDGGATTPTESERWDWVLAHVALAQETGEPLSTYLGPAYLELWDEIVRVHPTLAALYRP